MNRFYKITAWVLGIIVLGFLIQYPISKTESTWTSWSLPLLEQTIVIDPVHGGRGGGEVGRDNINEKEIWLAVSKKLQSYLQQAGALVYLTRETDTDLAGDGTQGLSKRKSEDIRNRLSFIHERNADFFVTIHLNAIPSSR